jgi:hypothetical protein
VVQVHVLARVWGFESLLRHQSHNRSSFIPKLREYRANGSVGGESETINFRIDPAPDLGGGAAHPARTGAGAEARREKVDDLFPTLRQRQLRPDRAATFRFRLSARSSLDCHSDRRGMLQ